jgi:hypothetical protein
MIDSLLRLLKVRRTIVHKSELLRRKQSIETESTDRSRWESKESFGKTWSRRAELAAAMIQKSKVVCDIGCGMQDLRRELQDGVKYLPMDIKIWTPDTLECEINERNLPLDYIRAAEVTTLLGVMEYLKEPVWVLQQIAENCPALLVSYCTTHRDETTQERARNGWMNAFTAADFEALLGSTNWTVTDKRLYGKSQWLWLCKPAE